MIPIPKVLVCCPTNRVKDYCGKDFMNVLRNLTYPNYDVFLCDNSPDKLYSKHINEMGIPCGWINPIGLTNREYMAKSQERCRKEALLGKYDYMFNLETDIFPSCPDIIERLMFAKKKVISGMYHILTGRDSHLCIAVQVPSGDIGIVDTVMLRDGMDVGFVDGTVKQVYQGGLGCTLIHKSAFEKIKFRVTNLDFHADTYFYIDIANLGIPAFVDTSIMCEHRNVKWTTEMKQ